MHEMTVEEVAERYDLESHPEGGFYRETWRAGLSLGAEALPDHPGERDAGTSMLYLLPEGEASRLHRIRSEELWLHHAGNPLRLGLRPERDSEETVYRLGPGPEGVLQTTIPGDYWQTARPLEGEAGWSLVACVVVPGFEFEDFEMEGE